RAPPRHRLVAGCARGGPRAAAPQPRAPGSGLDPAARAARGAVSARPRLRSRHRSVLQRQHAAGAGSAAHDAGEDRENEEMKRAAGSLPVIGIAGWKKSGKTTLATRLIAEFTQRGLKVATVKHAHHDFQIDD